MEENPDRILWCLDCKILQTPSEDIEVLTQKAEIVKGRFEAIDANIKIQTDIFNAKTIAIHALKVAIDNDPSVDNKQFALAQVIEKRYNNLKDIIFSKRAEIVEAENEQKAIQVYFNELAKTLRQHEREAIRLKDTQYKPLEPAVVKKPRAITVKKYDKDAIRQVAKDTGINEAILQMICVAQNLTPVDAARQYKETKSANS
jgi:hypothetical protein